eukprot:TRINITY_DN2478_c2_g2_i1.p1 TRINITY_DN2478_c2_g2~~TRINITY_DN2478_c2_g2_i1.p1  ORF type:complete len:435 (-),score=85.86 TRINITY_DN2478_c2_g2_i1:98-1402(-)
MDKQLKQLAAQQAELKKVQQEAVRMKSDAEEEARQTKLQAKLEAEALTRRVVEEMNLQRDAMTAQADAHDAASVRRNAEAEARAMKVAAETEAAQMRKRASEEVANMRKLAEEEATMLRNMETKKRQMEEQVNVTAARARERMTDEVDSLRRKAEAEVHALRTKATKEAAAMFQRAERNVHLDKPPRLPSTQSQPEEPPVRAGTPPRPDHKSPTEGTEDPTLHQPIQHNWTAGWAPPRGGLPPLAAPAPAPAPPEKSNSTRGEKGGIVPDMTQLVPYKLKLCIKFMQTGHCKRGAGCTYAHGEHEVGMDRPQELQGVTLAEMNARKKGKNMVSADTSRGSQPPRAPAPAPARAPAPAPATGYRTGAKSQWDQPPKINAKLNTGKPKSGPNKDPSPFLPLSPSLDEPWRGDSDGRSAMSWADASTSPPTIGPRTP